jgi:hypothetical protein
MAMSLKAFNPRSPAMSGVAIEPTTGIALKKTFPTSPITLPNVSAQYTFLAAAALVANCFLACAWYLASAATIFGWAFLNASIAALVAPRPLGIPGIPSWNGLLIPVTPKRPALGLAGHNWGGGAAG